MREILFVVLLLAYGVLRASMPPSLWSAAPTLEGYLWGCLAPPLLDLAAMMAIAHFAAFNFPIPEPWLKAFVSVTLLSGAYGFFVDTKPVIDDLRHLKSQEAVIIQKREHQEVVLYWGADRTATASVFLPSGEQYQRVPVHFPLQLRVAPKLGIAYVTGVLE